MKVRPTITNRAFLLVVGLCLIGISFHIHDDIPVFSDQHQLEHHISLDQPDCLACLHLIQSLPTQSQIGSTLSFQTHTFLLQNQLFAGTGDYHRISNKSPPTYT
ncbi:hypothetical protein [Fodinibius sp.]|uniref:hypothetical protein n=1 Tax=Fodinibius sp. TaxID=1872440 RepID=UPI002ACE3D64|nr:hypothetical protein [Fodinibius sp.]MDZ7659290.1 hypothetical protein [Fodinibius sp.]